MSKMTFDILSASGGVVEMRIEATRVTPRLVLDQRARLRALRTIGLENLPEEFVEDIFAGDLSRFTEILNRDVVEERGPFKTVGYTVGVDI